MAGAAIPGFSSIDMRENARFVPNFVSVAPHAVHGAIVLSDTAAFGQVWLDRKSPQPFIAALLRGGHAHSQLESRMSRLDRQSFLGLRATPSSTPPRSVSSAWAAAARMSRSRPRTWESAAMSTPIPT